MMYLWCSFAIVILLRAVENKGSPTWPYGEYTLLKPSTGCPAGWDDEGYLYQYTINKNPSNNRSETLHIDGELASNYVHRYFCSKTDKIHTQVWPSGQYCVYVNEEETLYDMARGSIVMYDRGKKNKDEKTFTKILKFIKKTFWKSNERTSLYFACQTSGNKKIPISLPITKPFYLLPYGSRDCQQVKWMVATTEWIKYHTNNDNTKRGQTSGAVPYHELGDIDNKGITMFYCYYERCKYTLRDKKGVFQSPGFPGKYPDGQLCSWRIMVPDNHTLLFNFTNFSLNKNDTLRYSKRINGSYRSRYTIPFSKVPFTLSADRDIRFVFRSDESSSSSGFRAEYRIIIPQVTIKPTETGTLSTATPTMASTKSLSTSLGTTTPTEKPVTTPSMASPTPSSKSKLYTTKPRSSTLSTSTKTSTPHPFRNDSNAEPIKDSPFSSRNKAIVVIVIPAVCLLIGVVLLIIIIYQYRNRRGHASNPKRDNEAADRSVMNPTYERGAILLNPSNETATANLVLNIGVGFGMYEDSCDTQEYEDVECEKLNKATPNGNPKKSGAKISGSIKDSDHNPLYHVSEVHDPENISCTSQSEPRESDVVLDSGTNPLYHVLERPGPNIGLSEDQSNSPWRESDAVQDSGPNPLYHVLEGPDSNNAALAEDRTYEDVD